MQDSDDILTIELVGKNDHIRVECLLEIAHDILSILRSLDAKLAQKQSPTLSWCIVDASKQSPLRLTIDAHPLRSAQGRFSRNVASILRRELRVLENESVRPKYFDDELLFKAKDLVKPLNNGLISLVLSARGEDVVTPTQRIAAHVDAITYVAEKPHYETTTLIGKLEGVNLHGTSTFKIYHPLTGKSIECHFLRSDLENVGYALDKRVSVYGRAKYDRTGNPISIDVERLEVIPDRKNLPQFDDLKGIDITGGTDSADHVQRFRDGG